MASNAKQSKKNKTPKKSISQIEAEVEAARARLEGTVQELTVRAKPQEIARRQMDSTRIKLTEATHTPDGQLRTDRLGAVLGAVAVALLVMGLLRRRQS